MKTKRSNSKRVLNRARSAGSHERLVMRRPETPLQEVQRMKLMMRHFRKLTMPSRDFVKWLTEKHSTDQLPEAA